MAEQDLLVFAFIGFCCGVTATLLVQAVVSRIRAKILSEGP